MKLSATKLFLWLLSGDILLQSPVVLGQVAANDTGANPHTQANIPCHSCCPGLPGMPGTPGYGIPGQNGEHGIPGLPGQTGEQGPKGDSGNNGEQGIQGKKGEIGIGAKGQKGESGFPGKLGPAGPVGQKGSPGVPGSIGLKGKKGETGPIGMPGSPGPVGSAPIQRRSAFTVVDTRNSFQLTTTDPKIKLNTVKLNIGNNYNKNSGVFTSTIPGVYFFSYSYHIHEKNVGQIELKKNGQTIVGSFAESGSYGQAGQVATLQLQINDTVWIEFTTSKKSIYADGRGLTSFTGFLIYET